MSIIDKFEAFLKQDKRREILELANDFADSKLIGYTNVGIEPFIKSVKESIEEIEEVAIKEGGVIDRPLLENCFEIYLRAIS